MRKLFLVLTLNLKSKLKLILKLKSCKISILGSLNLIKFKLQQTQREKCPYSELF